MLFANLWMGVALANDAEATTSVCAPGDSNEACAGKIVEAVRNGSQGVRRLDRVSQDALAAAVAEALAARPGLPGSLSDSDVRKVLRRAADALNGEPVALPAPASPSGCAADPRDGFSRYPDLFTVCVDATDGLRVSEIPIGEGYLHPLPSQRIRVEVLRRPGDGVVVGYTGTPGATAAGVDGERSSPGPATADVGRSPGASAQAEAWTALADELRKLVGAKAPALDAAEASLRTLTPLLQDLPELDPQRTGELRADFELARALVEGPTASDAVRDQLEVIRKKVVEASGPRWETFVLPTFVPGDVTLHFEVIPGGLAELRVAATELEGGAKRDDVLAGLIGDPRTAVEQALVALRKSAGALRQAVSALTSANGAWVARAVDEVHRLDEDLRSIDGTAEQRIASLQELTDRVDGLKDQVAAESPVKYDHTLTVDSTYSSAFRAGVAVHSFGAANASYGPVEFEGQTVIDSSPVSKLDLELVLGFTQFIHRVPSTSHAVRYGPTVAVGVADLTEARISALQSAFLGFEVGGKGLSVAVGPAVRRVSRLKDPYVPGGAVAAGVTAEDLVSQRWGAGLSIVVYAPQLFSVNGGSEP